MSSKAGNLPYIQGAALSFLCAYFVCENIKEAAGNGLLRLLSPMGLSAVIIGTRIWSATSENKKSDASFTRGQELRH
jgi:hypothetical protein